VADRGVGMPSRSLLYAIFPLCHRLILQVSTICVSEVHQVETFFVAMTKLSGEGVLPLLRYVDHDPDTSRASPLHQYASLTVSESPDSTALLLAVRKTHCFRVVRIGLHSQSLILCTETAACP
jgi:hypothetical protein